MSHRGGSLEQIENTLAAFRHSASLGVDMLEMDIHSTKDGHIVIFHDHTLERVCGTKDKSVDDYNLSELPQLLIPERLKHMEGQLLRDLDSRRIPLLEEVLREHPMCVSFWFIQLRTDYGFRIPMSIDVKTASEETIIKVGNLLRTYNRTHLTVWGSFHSHQTTLCHKHFPEIPLHFCKPRVIYSFAMAVFGLAGWIEYKEKFMAIPDYKVLLWVGRWLGWFKALNRRGVQVIVWGTGKDGGGPGGDINTVEKFELVRSSGANGICTDSPTLLKKWLETNPMKDFD
ncbi:UNVERIFIED_CONTAM: Lysophospholipase D gdpd1 [Siphonaria sp. JEL0065]|nr:Lysophospholipase D gdpd1 [Siphonaria sp. JEL0065]